MDHHRNPQSITDNKFRLLRYQVQGQQISQVFLEVWVQSKKVAQHVRIIQNRVGDEFSQLKDLPFLLEELRSFFCALIPTAPLFELLDLILLLFDEV